MQNKQKQTSPWFVLVNLNVFAVFYKQLAKFLQNRMSKGWSATSRSETQQYLLFEVSFVLVLLVELLLAGLVGKHIASGKLGGLDMGETYKRWKHEEFYMRNTKELSLLKKISLRSSS